MAEEGALGAAATALMGLSIVVVKPVLEVYSVLWSATVRMAGGVAVLLLYATFSRRIRSLYQGALLGWLKEQSKDSLLEPMQRVCRKLYTRLGRNELRRLWWIADKAMQGLRDGSVDNDLALRRLFARLDLTLKAMTEGGERGPASDTVTALSRALLFYAAQARPGSKATDLLRERFRLEELIPDRDALLRARGAVTGRDASLFHSIGEAVREELGQVKDTLDMELRTGRVDAEQREASRTSLQQLADTLEMLNLPVPAKAVEELLLVRGVTPELLFGLDVNRNGMVDPHEQGATLNIDVERADHWVSQGARPSKTVERLLEKARAEAPAEGSEAVPSEESEAPAAEAEAEAKEAAEAPAEPAVEAEAPAEPEAPAEAEAKTETEESAETAAEAKAESKAEAEADKA